MHYGIMIKSVHTTQYDIRFLRYSEYQPLEFVIYWC